jgi:hypothetical protein
MSIVSAVMSASTTFLDVLGEIPKVVTFAEGLEKAITDAEQPGVPGVTKLDNVLNDAETLLNEINPAWGGDFAVIAPEIESVVNAAVAFANVFAKPQAPLPSAA